MILLSGNILKRIQYAFIISALFLFLLRPETASGNIPSLSLNPIIAPPGTSITITGTGFPANKSGEAWFDTNMDGIQNASEPYVSAGTDGNGVLTTTGTLTVPNAPPGFYPVRVRLSVDSGHLETYNLFNISRSNITIGLSSGPPGTAIIISGSDFAPNESGWAWFDTNKNYTKDVEEPAMWVTPDENGEFKATLTIPNVAPDSYPVLVDLPNDGNYDSWTTFNVVSQFIVTPASML